jgi:uncharacterized protein YbbC (DUF1343 family)
MIISKVPATAGHGQSEWHAAPFRLGRDRPVRHASRRSARSVGGLLTLATLAGLACAPLADTHEPAGPAAAGPPTHEYPADRPDAGREPTGPAAADTLAHDPTAAPVLLGVDVLVRDGLELLVGRRVGLITNHTGRSWSADGAPAGVSTIDLVHQHPGIDLVALFSPEHGIRGDVDRPVASGVDDRTGLPIHSLYGATRKPTPDMLRGIDVLVFDIQDIGTRYYSYVWTMALAMEAAAENGLAFVVLDRPNPVGGELVQGNVKPSYMPVAFYETAARHGMTAAEIARYVNGEYRLGTDLHVVPMEGWRRSMWWEATGVPWHPPSPNMPSVESATHYPGTCLFEGTNLSVGRGTPMAFQQFGAPWLDAESVAAALGRRALPGVAIEVVTFVPVGPTDGKHPGATVRGIRLTVTDRQLYDPFQTGVAALLEIVARHPSEFRWREGWFDGLAGGPRLRRLVTRGAPLEEITAPWPAERAAFERARQAYLLY